MKFNTRVRVLIGAGALASAVLVGCSSDSSEQMADEVRSNPSPELDTLWQRRTDMDNAIAVTTDENWRMFNEDMGRFWLLDRPSILTPEPVPR